VCVRWYLCYPPAYEHVAELLAERGVEVDPSCIWRWVQAYAPELNKRCHPHLKPTNKSYRTDETYISRLKAKTIPVSRTGLDRPNHRIPAHSQTGRGGGPNASSARPLSSLPGNGVPRVISVDKNPAYPAAVER